MAHVIMGHGVSLCFGTSLAPEPNSTLLFNRPS